MTMRSSFQVHSYSWWHLWIGSVGTVLLLRTFEIWRVGGINDDHDHLFHETPPIAKATKHDHREIETATTTTWLRPIVPQQTTHHHRIPPENRKILFVHVGKAGGETIKQILSVGCQSMQNRKRRNVCLLQQQQRSNSSSNLSNHVYGYFHCYRHQILQKDSHRLKTNKTSFNTYLFNVRHPVERIHSWYNYVHPQNCQKRRTNMEEGEKATKSEAVPDIRSAHKEKIGLSCAAQHQAKMDPDGFVARFFYHCFPNVNEWANAIQSQESSSVPGSSVQSTKPWSEACRDLARDAISGQLNRHHASIATHLMANYEHYVNHTVRKYPEKDVLVVRIHHLWSDLQNIDRHFLQGTGDFGNFTGTAVTHGSPNSSSVMTRKSQQIFCCALQSELLFYRELIERAINLHPGEQSETLQKAVEYCGFSTWEHMMRDCSFHTTIVAPQ